MLKKIIISGILAASTALAHADAPAPTRWEFSWSGFYSSWDGNFHPDFNYTGTFGGVDANHDGVISRGEVTELNIRGIDYANCQGNCSLTWFSYELGGRLDFSAAGRQYFDVPPHWVYTDVEYEAGAYIHYISYGAALRDEWMYYFTPETVQTITLLTPVTEPDSFAMLGAGLLMLAGLARSRKRQGR